MFKLIIFMGFLACFVTAFNKEDKKCVVCLCHAITGCFKLETCAHESISPTYWRDTLKPGQNNDVYTFRDCMKNEKCLINTVLKSTSRYDEFDPNCDGTFDCKDRFSIHLFDNQKNVTFGKNYAYRFNNCMGYEDSQKLNAREHFCMQ